MGHSARSDSPSHFNGMNQENKLHARIEPMQHFAKAANRRLSAMEAESAIRYLIERRLLTTLKKGIEIQFESLFLHWQSAQVILFSNLNAIVAQDCVGRGHVKIKIRNNMMMSKI